MIVNVRTYTLVARMMPKYLKLFEELALPATERHGMELMGYYSSVIGPQNQVVHLWKYDSLADMEARVFPYQIESAGFPNRSNSDSRSVLEAEASMNGKTLFA